MNLILHTVFKPLMVGALLTLVPLAAQGPGPERGPRHDKGPRLDLPGLTEAQKSSLKTIADNHKSALEAKRKAESEAQEAFHKAMQDPATKEADLKALFERVNQARFAMLLEHRALMQENLAILTPEQKTELQKKRSERGSCPEDGPRHERRGHGKGGPRHDGPDAK